MKDRKSIQFKLNNEVIVEELNELSIIEILAYKKNIAKELEVDEDLIEVEQVSMYVKDNDISTDVDLTTEGLVFWRSAYHDPIQGIRCKLEEGSNEYLDTLLNGTIEEHLEFYIK